MRKTASVLFLILCIAVSVLGAINAFGDDAEVRAAAQSVAAASRNDEKRRPDKPSPVALTRAEMSPFGRTYAFATARGEVTVTCRRAAIFVGEWRCVAT